MSQTEITIDKLVPIPPKQPSTKWKTVYDRMENGDSFMVPTESLRNSVLAGLPGLITTRKINGSGYRIWKIK